MYVNLEETAKGTRTKTKEKEQMGTISRKKDQENKTNKADRAPYGQVWQIQYPYRKHTHTGESF